MSSVIVAIPTYKRPNSLRRLLEAVGAITTPIQVLVADNDPAQAEGASVAEAFARRGYPHPISAIIVRERGIAPVRNALAAYALAEPGAQFIAMIDDDEEPCEGWLESLLSVQAQTRAHVVCGPVRRLFEKKVPSHLENANNYAPGQIESGLVSALDATSNVLFDLAVFRENASPWFDPFFALTGGEDKDFMTVLRMQGRSFAWADGAQVVETLPASRCTTRWALQRAYSAGNSDLLVNLRRRPPEFSVISEVVKVGGAFGAGVFCVIVLAVLPSRRFQGLRLIARAFGKCAAFLGYRHLEYENIHGA